jgi:hypothetical protein
MKKEYVDKMLTWGGKSVVDNIEYDKLIEEDIKGEEDILKRMYLFKDFKVVIIGNDLGNCHDSCRQLLKQGYDYFHAVEESYKDSQEVLDERKITK